MVDYSKWDKFGDDEEEEINKGPVVTTFDGEKGRSFVIGPAGSFLLYHFLSPSPNLQSSFCYIELPYLF
jgi:hypothetical protein